LTVENKSGKNVTLISVGGAVYNAQTEALIKNASYIHFHSLVFANEFSSAHYLDLQSSVDRIGQAAGSVHFLQRVRAFASYVSRFIDAEFSQVQGWLSFSSTFGNSS
jgi:hypothetical protein